MSCASCQSNNQAEFPAEVLIHFNGLRHVDNPGVLTFPTLSVCLDCGLSRFTTPEPELQTLANGVAADARRQSSPDKPRAA
jgi:hypothetical protein